MSATLYRRYLRLCQNWKIDVSKRGRDFAVYLRDRVGTEFRRGEFTRVSDEHSCSLKLQALERLADNLHFERCTVKPRFSASGCTADECNILLSTDVLYSHLDKAEEMSFVSQLKNKFSEFSYTRLAVKSSV